MKPARPGSVLKKFDTLISIIVVFAVGFVFGDYQAIRWLYKSCQEFGGAKLYSGAVISCTVEVLKP